MSKQRFPELDAAALRVTRDALHAYARVLGGWLTTTRARRKHWWHASLRPSLTGLTTGVVHDGEDFECELDFVASQLRVRTASQEFTEGLNGQPAASVASFLDQTLASVGVDPSLVPGENVRGERRYPGYSSEQALSMQRALASIATAFEKLRAVIPEETSPIQFWPHHFDLSMLWLPGEKIPGLDPADEEHSDKQMNFGFLFGDAGIDEPYFYATAYPLPDGLPMIELPAGTTWRSEGFSGAVLLYKDLIRQAEPENYLLTKWRGLLAAGREHLLERQPY